MNKVVVLAVAASERGSLKLPGGRAAETLAAIDADNSQSVDRQIRFN